MGEARGIRQALAEALAHVLSLDFTPGECHLKDVPAPSPQPGQVLLRLRGTLIDETHLADYRIGQVQAPYLVSAEVLQSGTGVIGLRRGAPVVAICRQPLGQYLLLDQDAVILTEQDRAASCMLLGIALALQAVPAAEEFPESTVIGSAGFVGLSLCALLKTTTPWVFGTSDPALLCAKDLGATHTHEWEQVLEDLQHQKPEERGYGAVLIETSGRHQYLDWAQNLTLKGGRVVLATPPRGELGIDATRFHYDQITWQALGPVKSAQVEAAGGHLGAVPDTLVTDCLPFKQLSQAFQQLDAERGICYLMTNETD